MFATLSLAQLVPAARDLFTGARDNAEIAGLLADPYGFTADDYTTGLALVEEVQSLDAAQKREYGEQFAATARAQQTAAELEGLFVAHRRLARIRHTSGSDGYRTLGLVGGVADTRSDLIKQADNFYRMIESTPALVDGIRGLTPQAVANGRALVAEAEAADQAQTTETGDAQRATVTRDDAISRLRASARELAEVAKIALADRPQLQESLGLRQRS